MPSPEAERILADIEAAWGELQKQIDPRGEAGLDDPTVAGWTAKEMLSHVAFWAEAVEGFVTGMWRNQPLPPGWQFGSGYTPGDGPWPHFQEHNDREARWGREHGTRNVLARLDAAHRRLVRFVATVTDEEAARDPRYWEEVSGHLQEHTDELRGVEQPKLTQEDVLGRLDAAWTPFKSAVDALGASGLDGKTRAGWTAKEMAATVAFWDEAAVGAIIGMIRRQPMPPGWRFGSGYEPTPGAEWPRADVHNAREAEWARAQSGGAVVARLERAHRELVDVLGTVTEQEMASDGAYFARLGGHYREHLSELEAPPQA